MILDTDQNIVNKQQDKLLKLASILKELEDSLKRFYDKNQDNIAALYSYLKINQNKELRWMSIMINLDDFEKVLNSLTDLIIEDYPEYVYHFY